MTYLAFICFIFAGSSAQSFVADPTRHHHVGFAVACFGVGILCAIRGAKA